MLEFHTIPVFIYICFIYEYIIFQFSPTREPRTLIADFIRPGGCGHGIDSGLSKMFVVCRPTSRDAIAKMIDGVAVGKGLNIKGKSAKKNHLSGYILVLLIQIANS